jgi:hypothetical protein
MNKIDPNAAAYPVFLQEGLSHNSHVDAGLSILALFALHAPVEIPEWFEHEKPSQDQITKAPSWAELKNEGDKRICRDWLYDGTFDLPDHLKWFQDQLEAHKEETAYWTSNDKCARYFQWRRYYAERMINELNNK